MDVINLSIGEPEVEPSRDLVALALDAAAAAGVVPVVAAGNDFDEFGRGSLSSPGTSRPGDHGRRRDEPGAARAAELASFSGVGPDAAVAAAEAGHQRTRRLDPLVGARRPMGVDVRDVDGDPADRRSRSPAARAPSRLVRRQAQGGADRVREPVERRRPAAAPPTRGGGGLADPAKADVPLVVASPASVSFGLVRPGATRAGQPSTSADTGGGAGPGTSRVEPVAAPAGADPRGPADGHRARLPRALGRASADTAVEGDVTGFVRLTRGADVRRIPFWFRVARPGLGSRVCRPRFARPESMPATRGASRLLPPDTDIPEVPADGVVSAVLRGPEQVFRVTLTQPRCELRRRDRPARAPASGSSRGSSSQVTRTASPATRRSRSTSTRIWRSSVTPFSPPGRSARSPGSYDVVFDSPTAAGAGSYAFRFWINDTRPPTAEARSIPRAARARLSSSGSPTPAPASTRPP